jgi:hypothetical protein
MEAVKSTELIPLTPKIIKNNNTKKYAEQVTLDLHEKMIRRALLIDCSNIIANNDSVSSGTEQKNRPQSRYVNDTLAAMRDMLITRGNFSSSDVIHLAPVTECARNRAISSSLENSVSWIRTWLLTNRGGHDEISHTLFLYVYGMLTAPDDAQPEERADKLPEDSLTWRRFIPSLIFSDGNKIPFSKFTAILSEQLESNSRLHVVFDCCCRDDERTRCFGIGSERRPLFEMFPAKGRGNIMALVSVNPFVSEKIVKTTKKTNPHRKRRGTLSVTHEEISVSRALMCACFTRFLQLQSASSTTYRSFVRSFPVWARSLSSIEPEETHGDERENVEDKERENKRQWLVPPLFVSSKSYCTGNESLMLKEKAALLDSMILA